MTTHDKCLSERALRPLPHFDVDGGLELWSLALSIRHYGCDRAVMAVVCHDYVFRIFVMVMKSQYLVTKDHFVM